MNVPELFTRGIFYKQNPKAHTANKWPKTRHELWGFGSVPTGIPGAEPRAGYLSAAYVAGTSRLGLSDIN